MTIATDPEVLRVAVADTTSAVINTLKTTAVLAAAPGGSRYRIYEVVLAFDLGTGTPAGTTTVLGQIAPVSGPYLSIGFPNQPSDRFVFPQGFPITAAAAINLRTWPSTAVATAFVCSVLYVVEQV